MEKNQIEERIRKVAARTEKLIESLDTFHNRIEAARASHNEELVEYYEEQFNKSSAEFMSGVEILLDDWYALHGEKRSHLLEEPLSVEDIDEIHSTVSRIVMGLSAEVKQREREPYARIEPPLQQQVQQVANRAPAGSKHKVDVTG